MAGMCCNMQMPVLEKPAHERFARARAGGMGRVAAYEAAGYRPDSSRASKLGARPEVAARIAELRAREPDPEIAGAGAVIVRLIDLADAARALTSAAGLREARIALVEANRLQTELTARDAFEDPPPRRVQLTDEEWLEKFAPKEAR